MYKLPSKGKNWTQSNRSDVLSDLWSSFNLDLQSNLGVIRLGPRLRINTSTSDDSDISTPVAFKYFGGKWWTACGTKLFSSASALPNSAFTEDASSGAVSTYSRDTSDLEIFGGRLWAAADGDLYSNGSSGTIGSWDNRDTGLTAGLIHVCRTFPKFNRLYYTNGTEVRSINTGLTVASSGDYYISLQFGNLITSMGVSTNFIWIGISSKGNEHVGGINSFVIQWDGISPNPTKYWPVKAKAVLAVACDPQTDAVYIMDSNGVLSKFNGSGFTEVGRLPYTTHLPYNDDGLEADRFIHFNGLKVTKNGTVLANINNLNNDNDATIEENLPSGVWEWSPDNGFVHRAPFTYTAMGGSTITDFGQNRISRAGALELANYPSTTSGRDGTMLVGATYYYDASNTRSAIFVDNSLDTVRKAGYFVTTKIESQKIQDEWKKIFTAHKRFLNSTDKYIVKYRLDDPDATSISITWVNTTSFTTSTNISAKVGQEVEILQGPGSGLCAHITAVTGSGPYTATIDETATGVTTETAKARIQNWTKIGVCDNQSKDFGKFPINKHSNWVQFKVFMLFTGKNNFSNALITNNSPSAGIQLEA